MQPYPTICYCECKTLASKNGVICMASVQEWSTSVHPCSIGRSCSVNAFHE